MAKKPKAISNDKTRQLIIRVSEEEWALYKRAADEYSLPTSTWARMELCRIVKTPKLVEPFDAP